SMDVINFFFPNDTSTCFLFPPGCMATTSIHSLAASDNGIYIHADVTHKQLFIEMNGKGKTDISLLNSIGQQVLFFDDVTTQQITINTAALSNGVYFVKIVNGTKSYAGKVLIE
ncbi:MAG: T9SS type A sorting domain-containing protein, partial [Bacteroidota bacterium]